MAKTENIWNAIVNILNSAKQTGQPLEYVKNIYQGIKEDLPVSFTPAIILEPLTETEENITTPYNKKITFEILIECVLESVALTEQITGNTKGTKGILDIVADVKNVLNANRTLNDTCLKFEFPTTTYIFEMYPFRLADIVMRIEAISQDTTR